MPKYAGTARTTSLAPLPGMQSHSHMDSVFQIINLLFPTRAAGPFRSLRMCDDVGSGMQGALGPSGDNLICVDPWGSFP